MKRLLVVVVACVAICCVSAYARGDINLVTNGGFETGDFTGWTGTSALPGFGINGTEDFGDFTDVTTQDNGLLPRSGSYFAEFGDYNPPGPTTISQTIVTTPGQEYHFGWWLGSENLYGYPIQYPVVNIPNEMTVTWGGNVVDDITNFTSPTWTRFSFTEVATSDSTVISFSGWDNYVFVGLDNVNVEAIPEPATMIVWSLLGGCGIAVAMWRRKRAA
jgi:hypothetical protein